MFVDACAIVALLSGEPDAEAYGAVLAGATEPFTSPLAAFEAIIILARPEKFDLTFAASHALVTDWLSERNIALRHPLASPSEILERAICAATDHGIGKKRLSNFDCFHFAQATSEKATILTMDRLLRATSTDTAP